MKKVFSTIVFCMCAAAAYGLQPSDFYGAWDLSTLPGEDSVFSPLPGYGNTRWTLVSTEDKKDLAVVPDSNGTTKGLTLASGTGYGFAQVQRTNPADTIYEWSFAMEFMIPDSLGAYQRSLFSMGGWYREGLVVSPAGAIGNYQFLFGQSDSAIGANAWYQLVGSIKVGTQGYYDSSGHFTVYLNGEKLKDFYHPRKTFVSGQDYFPYSFFNTMFIDAPAIAHVAILNKSVDSADVADLQKTFFSSTGTSMPRKGTVYRPTALTSRQTAGGVFLFAEKSVSGRMTMYDIAGRSNRSLFMERGRAFLPRTALAPGTYLVRVNAARNQGYVYKLMVQ